MRLPPREQRPPFSNPPPQRESLTSEVTASYGQARFTGPGWVFLALLVLASLLTNIYLASKRPEPVLPPGMLTKDQFDGSMRERDERLNRRLDAMETDISYLRVTTRLVQDRLPPR